jgi:hypothetical protein
MNVHYANMARRLDSLQIPAAAQHYDDGVSELDPEPIPDWGEINGRGRRWLDRPTIRLPIPKDGS